MRVSTLMVLPALFAFAAAPAMAQPTPVPQASSRGGGPSDGPALAARVKEVLKTNCYACHGQDGTNDGGFNYVLDLARLASKNKVVAGQPDKSKLLKKILSGEMPPEDAKVRPSPADLEVLRGWIAAGCPGEAEPAAAPRQFIAPEMMLQFIANDLQANGERSRPYLRYFTLTHLYNAGLSEDEIQSHRLALSKLVNSLSWGPDVVIPRPIDPARTVFRIDLRDYGWNVDVWARIVAANPYRVTYRSNAARACYEQTKCQLPHVRADWFVAAASRPPLYHLVLELPKTDRELEAQLKVKAEEDIQTERVARAGFTDSGVSRNNRLLERHRSAYGAYWKSYDFKSGVGRRNLLAQPLGPGTGSYAFEHDGGEIIFTLPNGLHGYLLVDAKGERIDRGPIEVVRDLKQPDSAVVNGISCMSCHAAGLIAKDDQVRDHVQRSLRAFPRAEAETVLALYPPKEEFARLVREDAERFRQAVEKTGVKLSRTEPIFALAHRFEDALDLPQAAAELGLPPAEFQRLLAERPELTRVLAITQAGVSRQLFVDTFPELVRGAKGTPWEKELGAYLGPVRSSSPPRLPYPVAFRTGDVLRESTNAECRVQMYGKSKVVTISLNQSSASTLSFQNVDPSGRPLEATRINQYERLRTWSQLPGQPPRQEDTNGPDHLAIVRYHWSGKQYVPTVVRGATSKPKPTAFLCNENFLPATALAIGQVATLSGNEVLPEGLQEFTPHGRFTIALKEEKPSAAGAIKVFQLSGRGTLHIPGARPLDFPDCTLVIVFYYDVAGQFVTRGDGELRARATLKADDGSNIPAEVTMNFQYLSEKRAGSASQPDQVPLPERSEPRPTVAPAPSPAPTPNPTPVPAPSPMPTPPPAIVPVPDPGTQSDGEGRRFGNGRLQRRLGNAFRGGRPEDQ